MLVTARDRVFRIADLNTVIIDAALTNIGVAPRVVSTPWQAEPAAIPKRTIAVFRAVVIAPTGQVNALTRVGIAELALTAAGWVVDAAAILAASIVRVTKPRVVGATICVFYTLGAAWVGATIGGPL